LSLENCIAVFNLDSSQGIKHRIGDLEFLIKSWWASLGEGLPDEEWNKEIHRLSSDSRPFVLLEAERNFMSTVAGQEVVTRIEETEAPDNFNEFQRRSAEAELESCPQAIAV
jgi:hypothetical protein